MKGKTIKITSEGPSATTPIGINGRRRRLAHHREIAVSAAELEVLENSRVKFEVIGDAKAADLKAAVDYGDGDAHGPTDETETVAGADNLVKPEPVPAIAVRTTPPENDTPAGADNLTQSPGIGEELTGEARQEALDAQAAAADGTAEPAVVLTNEDPDQTGKVALEASEAAAKAEAKPAKAPAKPKRKKAAVAKKPA